MKSQLRAWLAYGEFQKIVDAALQRERTLSILISLTYDPDPLVGWRAVDAIGRCAAHLSGTQPETLRNYLRRLFWMMRDESGAIAWRAPETIGEIIRSDPAAFADFIPISVSLLDLGPEDRSRFLPGILYALGRIGEASPGAVREALSSVLDALQNSNAQVRAMAIQCLGRLGECGALSQHKRLAHDNAQVVIYCDGQLVEGTVGGLFAQVLSAFPSQSPDETR